ncbi:MAG TPA: sigma-70 family RNA polymerase sigma factor, partial [Planctomycetota bacterium]|nr:sigma-70 family RNA polymerase sigma factor [Planctomycetota bacterium]
MKTDAELLGAFVERRDQGAFEALVRRHERLVVSVCLRVLDDRDEALDAAQAAFLALALKAGRLDRGRPLAPWLHRVAHAVAVSARRSRDARRAREREVSAMAGQAGSDVGELRAMLDQEIDALPDRYRRPVVMVHLEGRTLEETAS